MSQDPKHQAADPSTPEEQLRAFADDANLAPFVAQNPSASPDILALLSQSADPAVLQAVARNPNTPLPALFHAGRQFPQAFLENPALSLFWLERPDFFGQIPSAVLQRLLSHPMPEEWLAQIAMHGPTNVQYAMSNQASTPTQVLAQLVSVRPALASRVAGHPNATPEILARLAEIPDACHAVAQNPRTPPKTLGWLLAAAEPSVRRLAVQNPNTPKDLYRLLKKASGSVDLVRANQPNAMLSQDELLLLSQHNVFARQLAARHPNTPAALLEALCSDPHPLVRQAAAENPTTSLTALERFARDEHPTVRQAVALAEKLPVHLLASLLEEFAGRPEAPLPPSLLLRILPAQASLQDWQALFARPQLRPILAQHPQTPLTLLSALAQDTQPQTRLHVATRPDTPPAILAMLQDDPDPKVQEALLHHPSLPPEALRHFADSASYKLRGMAAQHANTPASALIALSSDRIAVVRKLVAQHPSTPPAILALLQRDKNLAVRRAVERNPKAQKPLLP